MALIGRYETHEQIGRGTMGIVYRARDTVLDRFVALKVLVPDLDPEIRERFYREARSGAKLQHPNIAIVHDLGEYNNTPYIAMELLSGADLRKYIEENRPLPLIQKIEILAQVCDGLAHAHQQGIVHRDIKPSNIFIHEDRHVKILDFGIARLPTSTLTKFGCMLGTPNYMSPEQILTRPCDSRSDIFSAAIVFYELLVYAHPFRSAFIPRRIAEDSPDSLYDRDPLTPPALEELLQRGLAKRPGDRIQTAQEFAAGLRGVLEDLRSGLAPHEIASRPVAVGIAPVPPAKTMPLNQEDDDSRARRVAGFISAVNEFEAALASDALTVARRSLEQMRNLASADASLAVSLAVYEKQLAEASELRVSQKAKTDQPRAMAAAAGAFSSSRTLPVDPPQSSVSRPSSDLDPLSQSATRLSSKTTAAWDARKSVGHSLPAAPSNADSISPDGESRSRKVAPRLEHLRATGAAIRARLLSLTPMQKGLIAACAFLIIVLPIAAPVAIPRPEIIRPYIGRAIVRGSAAYILASQTAAGRRLASLREGTPVNILDRVQPGQQWVHVQAPSAGGRKTSKPGYVSFALLSNWSSDKPQYAWDFLSLSKPPDASPAEALLSFADKLEDLSTRFPTLAPQAELERGRTFVLAAQKSKASGEPQAARQEMLNRADRTLASLPSNLTSEQSADRDQLVTQIADLRKPDLPPTAPPPANDDIIKMLRQVGALWNEGNLQAALSLTNRILSRDPANVKAQNWKQRIDCALTIENGGSC